MERSGDTRTIAAPITMYEHPWDFNFNFNLGVDYGNFNQLSTGGNATFYQYFEKPDIGYYIQGRYFYLSRNWEQLRLAGGEQ